MNAAPLNVTRFAKLFDPSGEAATLTWSELGAMLRTPRPRPSDPTKPQLPGWAPATFANGFREKDAVAEVSALCLDFDKGSTPLEELRAAFAGITAYVHNTRRSTPAAPRWRATVAVSRAMSPAEHALVWARERERLASLGLVVDEQTKDASRFWFVPCEPSAGDFIFEELEGEPLDVDAIVTAATAKRSAATTSSLRLVQSPSSTPSSGEPAWLASISPATRKRRAAAWLEHAETAVSGERGHSVAMRAATGVVRGFALDCADALEVLSVWSARCSPPWSAAELTHKVDEASRIGNLAWGAKLSPESAVSNPTRSTSTGPASTSRPLLRPGDRVRSLAALGPVERLPTSIATLDRACRGGLPTRRLVVLGGAPSAGKTSLATAWAWQWAKHGVPVGVLAVDEGPEGTIGRIAQLEGIAPERVEERDPAALEQLAKALDDSALILVDGEDAAGSVEGVAELVSKAAADVGGLGVLVVDSIQTVRASGTENVDSARERVDAVVRALKGVRDRFGLLVVATCELARGAYRSRNLAEAINDLAAFKESGSVEYAAQTALVLRSVPDEASLIDVTVPKNRAYRRDPFRLRMDHATTQFEEVEMPAESSSGSARRSTDSLERDAAELRKLLVSAPGINGARAVRTALRARHVAMSNDRVGAALEFLRSRGELVNRGTERRPALHLKSPQTEEVETDE